MPAGTLEISGHLDPKQFYPYGTSDADTAHVDIDGPNAFRFRPHPTAQFQVTHAFDGAVVHGKTTKPVIDSKHRITIRFQKIDATEMHYRPQHDRGAKLSSATKALFKKFNKDYRQYQGETAAHALSRFLGSGGAIACRVVTRVDHPNDVFDTYGRCIAEIIVDDTHQTNLCDWLLERGYAVPTFYNSMDADEITHATDLANEARKHQRGVWKRGLFTQQTPAFNANLIFDQKATFDAAADRGPCSLPKIFRRQTNWYACRNAGIISGGLFTYLRQQKRDLCAETSDFLSHGATAADYRQLSEFLSPQLKLLVRPYDLVFKEEPSKLLGPDGKMPSWH